MTNFAEDTYEPSCTYSIFAASWTLDAHEQLNTRGISQKEKWLCTSAQVIFYLLSLFELSFTGKEEVGWACAVNKGNGNTTWRSALEAPRPTATMPRWPAAHIYLFLYDFYVSYCISPMFYLYFTNCKFSLSPRSPFLFFCVVKLLYSIVYLLQLLLLVCTINKHYIIITYCSKWAGEKGRGLKKGGGGIRAISPMRRLESDPIPVIFHWNFPGIGHSISGIGSEFCWNREALSREEIRTGPKGRSYDWKEGNDCIVLSFYFISSSCLIF